MHEPKVKSVTEGGAAAGAGHGTGKRKAFILRWGARQRLIEKALRQLSTFIDTIKIKSIGA